MSIAELRQETSLSQRQFAELFGIPVRTLQQWEQGKSSPAPYVVSMMKRLLADGRRPSTKQYAIPPHHVWRVCIEDPFDQCQRVYPTQQRKVREIIDDLSRDPAVLGITVFGSSVTEQCHAGSDVDVYVEMTENRNPMKDAHDFPFDLWTNYTVDDRLNAEIAKKGVKVYGKRPDSLR